MVRKLLLYGMLVGLAAGVLAFVVAKTIGEPQVDKAIAFEGLVAASHHEAEEAELVSRTVQNTAGLGAGVIVYGVAFGGIFALVFALAYGRLGTLTARGTAAALGLVGFVAVYLVPILKYPATPPAVGNPDTIGRRTTLYLLMIVISVAAAVIAVIVRKRLRDRIGDWYATIAVALGYLVVVVVAYIVLPGVNDVPQVLFEGVTDAVGDSRRHVPARRAVAIPHRLDRRAGGHLGDDRHRVRLPRHAAARAGLAAGTRRRRRRLTVVIPPSIGGIGASRTQWGATSEWTIVPTSAANVIRRLGGSPLWPRTPRGLDASGRPASPRIPGNYQAFCSGANKNRTCDLILIRDRKSPGRGARSSSTRQFVSACVNCRKPLLHT